MIVKELDESIEILDAQPWWILCTGGLFFSGAWSVAFYALLTLGKQIPHVIFPQITYWGTIAFWFVLGVGLFDGMIRVRRFEIRPGVVMKYESRLGAFPFQRSYTSDVVDRIAVRKKGGRGIQWSAVLFLNTKKNILLERFHTEKEAADFCSQVTDLFRKR